MPKITANTINAIQLLLNEKKEVLIVSHHNPDGDAIGSMLGLYYALKQENIEASLIIPNEIPESLSWLPGADKIIRFSKHKEIAKKIITNSQVIFALDFNDPERLEKMSELFIKSNATKILIDHHPSPKKCFNHVISDIAASSTAELVYVFTTMLNKKITPDSNAATCLFTGIMTDTGSFSYGCNNPRTFKVAAELVKQGVNIEDVQQQVYNNFTEGRMRLVGYSLTNKLKVFPEYRTAFISLTRDELNSFDYKIGDTEGIVNYPLSIKGIIFSALFIENTDYIKVSLRSKGEFPANKICENHFAGGGHKNAAGGKSFASMQETEEQFVSILKEYKKDLNK